MSENVSEVAEVAVSADGATAESGENKSFIARSSGLKLPDYIGYALGDTACCLVFGLVTSLLQKFYTDIFGLGPLFIMLMMVGARIWDAINDPIMGRIADTIKVSRWGRYRPWFLYASVPLTLASILMFVKWPGMEEGSVGMMVYATVTYVLFGMCYTALSECAIRRFRFPTALSLPSSPRTKRSAPNFRCSAPSARAWAVFPSF